MTYRHPLVEGFPESEQDQTNPPHPLQPGELAQHLRDTFGDRLRFNSLIDGVWLDERPVTAIELDCFFVYLSGLGFKIDPKRASSTVVTVAREHTFSPVCEFLKQLKDDPGIDPINIATVAKDYLGLEDSLDSAILRTMLIGAVARALNPGSKFDTVFVLVGQQGIRKSTWLRNLFSDAWFNDTPQRDDRDMRMAMHSCWAMELAELETVTGKRASGELKALISSPTDRFRKPYGAVVEVFPRPSILVASCNRNDFLPDTTGSRRFHVVSLPDTPLDTEKVARDRCRIWKAALLEYEKGTQPYLGSAESALIERRNSNFSTELMFESQLSAWLDGVYTIASGITHKFPPITKPFSTEQALQRSGCRQSPSIVELRQACEALRSLGCVQEQFRYQGVKGRWWKRPSLVSAGSPGGGTPQNEGQTSNLGFLSHCPNTNQKENSKKVPGTEEGRELAPACGTPGTRDIWEAFSQVDPPADWRLGREGD